MGDRIGQQFGNYRLTRKLGRGGFAEVYLGEQIHIQTQAAIKILSTQMAATDLEHFIREARTIASLEHKHIVRVFDFGIQDDVPFLVMGYAPNGTLRQKYPRESRVPLEEVVGYVAQAAEALQYAHDRKIVHRDVKPENMLLGNQNELLLSDFGIAVTTTTSTSRETKATAGTVAYMAPEQVMGKATTASDQYALGITVYEWLAGKQPFQGSFFEVCAQHLHAPVPSLREANPNISAQVERCIFRSLEKEPEKRFGSIQEFASALQEAAQLTIASLTYMPTEVTNRADVAEYTPTQHLTPEQLPDFQSRQSGAHSAVDATRYDTPNLAGMGNVPQNTAASQMRPQSLNNSSPNNTNPNSFTQLPSDLAPTQASSAMPPMNSGAGNIYNTGPHNTRPVVYNNTEPPMMPPPMQPSGGMQPLYGGPAPRRRSSSRPLIIACVILLLVLIAGSVLFVPSVSNAFGRMLAINPRTPTQGGTGSGQQVTPTTSAGHKKASTAQATPKHEQKATPTETQQTSQPIVRTLSSTKSDYTTVDATGQGNTNAIQATGSITINNRGSELQLSAGTTITNANGCTATSLQVQLDRGVDLATGDSAVVSIHVTQAGSYGNIQDCNGNYAFNYCNPGPVCASNLSWNAYDNNGGFSGGADAQTYTAVSQYDVDKAAGPLKDSTKQYALSDLQQQLQSNEHLVGDAQCQSNVTSDPAVGAKAKQVTVTVSTTCTQQAST